MKIESLQLSRREWLAALFAGFAGTTWAVPPYDESEAPLFDWDAVNAEAAAEILLPVRPGIPGKRPFWNRASGQFVYVPAFEIPETEGAEGYRFELRNAVSDQLFSAVLPKPYEPITELWKKIPNGCYGMTVTPIAAGGTAEPVYSRMFIKQPRFFGPYLPPRRSYEEAGKLALRHVFRSEFVRGIARTGKFDPETDPFLAYPSKMGAAAIQGLCVYADLVSEESAEALKYAEAIADALTALNTNGAPNLRNLPVTYLGDKLAAKGKNHLLMMNYPLSAALAYAELYKRTHRSKDKEAALAVLETYSKIQETDGTWYLVRDWQTGEPVSENRLLAYSFILLADWAAGEGVTTYSETRERALGAFLNGPLQNFDWSGQFEDTPPAPPYSNLAKDMAIHFACYLTEHPEICTDAVKKAEEIIRFAEDQFFLWGPVDIPEPMKLRSAPKTAREIIYPVGLEQYFGMYAVNDSSGDGINGFMTMYRLTGNPLWLAKACALANVLTIAQYDDGEIPSGLDNYAARHSWVNGQISVALTLLELSKCCKNGGGSRNIYEF